MVGPKDHHMKPADNASLAEKVKSLQRDYPHLRERWAEHCGMYFKGIKDPYRHDEPALRALLNLYIASCEECDHCNLLDDNYCGGCGCSVR